MRDIAVIAVFFILPGAVALDSVVHLDPFGRLKNANRLPEVAATKGLVWTRLPARLEASHLNGIGFRNSLTRLHNWLYVELLSTSPLDAVTAGRRGWLFYHPPGFENVLLDSSCPDERVVAERVELFAQWHSWFKAQGVPYALVIVPGKTKMYRDLLPARLADYPLCPAFDEVVTRLKDRTEVPVIALEEPLRRARTSTGELLFGPSDTHWRCPGAYIGYREIMRWLSDFDRGLKALDRGAVEGAGYEEGDLARMLMLHGLLPRHEGTCVASRRESKAALEPVPRGPDTVVTSHSDTSLPRLFLFGDSMIGGPATLLGEHFSHARFVRKENFDPQAAMRFRPDYVVQISARRYLFDPDDGPPPSLELYELERRFRTGRTVLTLSERAINLRHDVETASAKTGVRVSVTGDDPYVVFRRVNAGDAGSALVKVVVDSPVETGLQLFYLSGTDPFSEEASIRREVETGRRTEIFEVPASPDLGTRLDFGSNGKDVTLLHYTIAALPPDDSTSGAASVAHHPGSPLGQR